MPDFIPIPGKERAAYTIASAIDTGKQRRGGSSSLVPEEQLNVFIPPLDEAADKVIPYVLCLGFMEYQRNFNYVDLGKAKSYPFSHNKMCNVKYNWNLSVDTLIKTSVGRFVS